MTKLILRDAKVWFDRFDVTGDANALALDHSAELQDATTFADSTRTRQGGLKVSLARLEGLWSGGANNVDEAFFDKIGFFASPLTVSPDGTVGNTAFGLKAIAGDYSPGAALGEMFSFKVSAEAAGDDLVRGILAENRTEGTSGNGTARQVGAVASGQKLFAALHVLAASGTAPTLDVSIESDDASAFLSPTTRLTFSQATGPVAQWAAPVAGAITDTWWRVAWAVGGTSPSFDFVVFLGIQ